MLALLLMTALTPPPPDAVAPPPPIAGTVAVALGAKDADPDTDQRFADAVGQALGADNFTSLPTPGHSRYVAQVSVVRQARGLVTTRVAKEPASAGIGSWGPAIRVPLGSHKTQLRDLVETRLDVRLVERAGGRQVWHGSAVTVGPDGAPVAGKLARAAVASYPQTVATPVSVP